MTAMAKSNKRMEHNLSDKTSTMTYRLINQVFYWRFSLSGIAHQGFENFDRIGIDGQNSIILSVLENL